jgi:NitT/TauT family transport system substrate-binding protein
MKRRSLLLLVGVLSLSLFFGCKDVNLETENEKTVPKEVTIMLSGPKAPPTFPLLRMIETNALGENVKIDFKIWNTVEELLTIATSSDYGFLATPVNVSAKLYNKGVDIKLINVDTWGVMYLMTTNSECNEWEELKGKKLHVPFKSAPPDIVTQYLLEENNVKVGTDIEFVYSTPVEIAQMVQAGEIEYAMNIEPFVTASMIGNEEVRVIFDYMEEWKKIKGDEYQIPNAGIIANNKFINENKELVILFEKEYEKALIWTLENPEEAAVLVEKHLGLNKELIQKSMPTLGLTYKKAFDAKTDLEIYYETLLNFDIESIGGEIPDDDYYYKEE